MSVPYAFNHSNTTAVERQPIHAKDVWTRIGDIPRVPVAIDGVLRQATALLTVAEGDRRFMPADAADLSQIIPANYFGAYAPVLTDAAARAIPYDPAIWVADGTLHCVEFGRPPAELGFAPPFQLVYWQYTGGTAASGASAVIDADRVLTALDLTAHIYWVATAATITLPPAANSAGASCTFRRRAGAVGGVTVDTVDTLYDVNNTPVDNLSLDIQLQFCSDGIAWYQM
jgi:hypothetical protein